MPVRDRSKQTAVVEAIEPLERCNSCNFHIAATAAASDDFGLVMTIDRRGQGIVMGVAGAAKNRDEYLPRSALRNRRFDCSGVTDVLEVTSDGSASNNKRFGSAGAVTSL